MTFKSLQIDAEKETAEITERVKKKLNTIPGLDVKYEVYGVGGRDRYGQMGVCYCYCAYGFGNREQRKGQPLHFGGYDIEKIKKFPDVHSSCVKEYKWLLDLAARAGAGDRIDCLLNALLSIGWDREFISPLGSRVELLEKLLEVDVHWDGESAFLVTGFEKPTRLVVDTDADDLPEDFRAWLERLERYAWINGHDKPNVTVEALIEIGMERHPMHEWQRAINATDIDIRWQSGWDEEADKKRKAGYWITGFGKLHFLPSMYDYEARGNAWLAKLAKHLGGEADDLPNLHWALRRVNNEREFRPIVLIEDSENPDYV